MKEKLEEKYNRGDTLTFAIMAELEEDIRGGGPVRLPLRWYEQYFDLLVPPSYLLGKPLTYRGRKVVCGEEVL